VPVHDLRERLQIFEDLLPDAGALDLHRHEPAVAQGGAVHLAQRGRGHGHVFEFRESLGDPDAQLGRDDLLDLLEGEGLDGVLKPRERLQVGRRQEVGARREKLSDLDQARPEPLEVAGELLGLGRALSRREPLRLGQVLVEGRP